MGSSQDAVMLTLREEEEAEEKGRRRRDQDEGLAEGGSYLNVSGNGVDAGSHDRRPAG